jgi:hypothetical protein
MPEIIEISGLEDDNKSDIATGLLAAGVGIGAFVLLGVVIPYLLGGSPKAALGDLGIIKPCRPEDMKPGRARRDQKWCLWDSKGKKIIGRHPSRSRALRQERLIQVRKRGR